MQPDLACPLELPHALQRLAQNCGLEFQLPLVTDVLVMATAALPEIRAARLDAIGRRLDHLSHPATRETGLLLPEVGLDLFSGQNIGHERRHAAASSFGRNARQAISAVNQFFDGKQLRDPLKSVF